MCTADTRSVYDKFLLYVALVVANISLDIHFKLSSSFILFPRWQAVPKQGAFPVMGQPRGSKMVPLNSWGRGSYECSFSSNYRPTTNHLAAVHLRDDQPANDVTTLPIPICAPVSLLLKCGAETLGIEQL